MNAKHRLLIPAGLGVLALLTSPIAALAQGSSQTPPSPNSSNNDPAPPGSLPQGARTLPPGSTGTQEEGSVKTTRIPQAPSEGATGTPKQR